MASSCAPDAGLVGVALTTYRTLFVSQTHKAPLPLNALRAFDQVMRQGSMSQAAQALGVTHGAVSRQVLALQQQLGTILFDGPRNARRPTAEAQRLWSEIGPAFDALTEAVTARAAAVRALRVSCLSTLAGRWLIPRLAHWAHGSEVELTESYADLDQALGGGNLAIRMLNPGSEVPQGLVAVPFMVNRSGPVLAPGVDPGTARRLLPRSFPQAIDAWTVRTGRPLGNNEPPRLFDHQQTMIQACIAGSGVCVTQAPLVETALAEGRLIAPFGFSDDGARFAVFHRRDEYGPSAQRLVAWLREQAGADRA